MKLFQFHIIGIMIGILSKKLGSYVGSYSHFCMIVLLFYFWAKIAQRYHENPKRAIWQFILMPSGVPIGFLIWYGGAHIEKIPNILCYSILYYLIVGVIGFWGQYRHNKAT